MPDSMLSHIIQKQRIKRIIHHSIASLIAALFALFTFYMIFIMFPPVFIFLGQAAYLFLPVCFSLVLVGVFGILSFIFPFYGRRFLSGIYKKNDNDRINYALQLEQGKNLPASDTQSPESTTKTLTQNYLTQTKKNIDTAWTGIRSHRAYKWIQWMLLAFTLVSIFFSVWRKDFLFDVWRAMTSDMPVVFLSWKNRLDFVSLRANIAPPAYMNNLSATNIDLTNTNHFTILSGSRIQLQGKIKTKSKSKIKSGTLIFASAQTVHHIPIQIHSEKNFSVSFIAQNKGAFIIQLIDDEKNNPKSRIYTIAARKDTKPQIVIHHPKQHHKMHYGNNVSIRYAARDDFGLREIYLFHRDAHAQGHYHKVLVARFPRANRTNYESKYVWNPIIKEGKKIATLIYPPSVTKVEYFLQAIDSNLFSAQGKAKSRIQYLHFQDKLADLTQAISRLKQIQKKGQDLQKNISDRQNQKRMSDDLQDFVKQWPNKWNKILPADKFLPHSQNLLKQLKQLKQLAGSNQADKKKALDNYLQYLQNYIMTLQMFAQAERVSQFQQHQNTIMNDFAQGKTKKSMDYVKKTLEQAKKKYAKQFSEIDKLIKQGKHEQAAAKFASLMAKIKNDMRQSMQSLNKKMMQMSRQAMKEINKIKQSAQDALQDQKKNLLTTKRKQFSAAAGKQKQLSGKLKAIYQQIKKIEKKYPFILANLKGNANMAALISHLAAAELDKKNLPDSIRLEKQVIRHLEDLLKGIQNQKKIFQNIQQGDFSQVMPSSMNQEYILIPKEAAYTVPLRFKKEIIEQSKNRGALTPALEKFWRSLLQ